MTFPALTSCAVFIPILEKIFDDYTKLFNK